MTQARAHHYAGDSTVPQILEVHVHDEGDPTLEVKVTFNVPMDFEGLVGALAMDGSGSMEGNYQAPGQRRGLFARFSGDAAETDSPVQKTMRAVVPFLAGIDATKSCFVFYWATGYDGRQLEEIGELTAEEGATREYPGPRHFGGYTYMEPAIARFIQYVLKCKQDGENVQSAVFFIATDGQIHDLPEVLDLSQNGIAPRIASGELPRMVINAIGVGNQVNLAQLHELEHESVPEELEDTVGEIFHGEHVDTVGQVEELIAHLIRADVVAFTGGAVVVDPATNTVIKSYEGDVPAVLELDVPRGTRRLVLRAGNGEELPFDLPEDDD